MRVWGARKERKGDTKNAKCFFVDWVVEVEIEIEIEIEIEVKVEADIDVVVDVDVAVVVGRASLLEFYTETL